MHPARLAFALFVLGPAVLAAETGGTNRPAGEETLMARMAAEGTNAVTLFAIADFCHDLGVTGDKAAVIRSEDYLRRLLDMDPTNAPAIALLGSVLTMKGRDAFWPVTQIRLVREGNQLMDRAVSLAPDDLHTRTIRALNNAHMPDFLGRTDIVRADLALLWESLEKDPTPFPVSARQEIALHWGRQLKRQHKPDEARRVWEAGRAFAPNSSEAAELAAELTKSR